MYGTMGVSCHLHCTFKRLVLVDKFAWKGGEASSSPICIEYRNRQRMLISNRRLFYGFNWDIFPNFRSKTWKIMETRPDMKTPRSSMVPKIDSGCSLYKCRSTDLKLRKLGVYHGLSKISIGWVTLPNDMISTLPSQVSGYYDIMSDIFGYQ